MKIVYNNIIPFKGFLAMCVWPFVFVRKDARRLNVTDINHEKIHGNQQLETMCVSVAVSVVLSVVARILPPWWITISPLVYFALYGLDYIVRLCLYGFDTKTAYRNIAFEQEAYMMQSDLEYLNGHNRKHFAWAKYLFKKTYTKK